MARKTIASLEAEIAILKERETRTGAEIMRQAEQIDRLLQAQNEALTFEQGFNEGVDVAEGRELIKHLGDAETVLASNLLSKMMQEDDDGDVEFFHPYIRSIAEAAVHCDIKAREMVANALRHGNGTPLPMYDDARESEEVASIRVNHAGVEYVRVLHGNGAVTDHKIVDGSRQQIVAEMHLRAGGLMGTPGNSFVSVRG